MNLSEVAPSLLKKKWTHHDIKELIGEYHSAYMAYAADERIRYGGASGGATTAILACAIQQRLIDGALVCKSHINEHNKLRTKFYIAEDQGALLLSQGSQYVQAGFVPEALRLIEEYNGKIAVVGLPCDLSVLKKKLKRDPSLCQKVQFTVGLFCGHNSQPQLIDNIIQKLTPTPESRLEFFRFRTGLWRGYSLTKFDNSPIIEKKSAYYNLYQNLYFFCQKKCLYCHDHFAYNADIAVGDIWSYHLKNKPIKHNAIISKNDKGAYILSMANESGGIYLEKIKIEEILDGQARGAPTHNNTSAKSKAAKKFGMQIPDRHQKQVKWNEYLAAWLIFFNYKWSMNQQYARLIFKVPRIFLKAYLLVFKGLESMK